MCEWIRVHMSTYAMSVLILALLLHTKFAFWFPPFPTRICGNSCPPARKIRVVLHNYPRVSARNNHGIPRKKLSFPCHVPYIDIRICKCACVSVCIYTHKTHNKHSCKHAPPHISTTTVFYSFTRAETLIRTCPCAIYVWLLYYPPISSQDGLDPLQLALPHPIF